MKTLKEELEFVSKGLNICDNVFDFCTYYDYDVKGTGYYDRLLDFMASKIEFVKYQKYGYSICKITQFIEAYQKQFDEFLNEVYCEEYTPKYICKKYNIDKITSDDELFCNVYIDLFYQLISGGFDENSYRRLFELLNN